MWVRAQLSSLLYQCNLCYTTGRLIMLEKVKQVLGIINETNVDGRSLKVGMVVKVKNLGVDDIRKFLKGEHISRVAVYKIKKIYQNGTCDLQINKDRPGIQHWSNDLVRRVPGKFLFPE